MTELVLGPGLKPGRHDFTLFFQAVLADGGRASPDSRCGSLPKSSRDLHVVPRTLVLGAMRVNEVFGGTIVAQSRRRQPFQLVAAAPDSEAIQVRLRARHVERRRDGVYDPGEGVLPGVASRRRRSRAPTVRRSESRHCACHRALPRSRRVRKRLTSIAPSWTWPRQPGPSECPTHPSTGPALAVPSHHPSPTCEIDR